VCELRRAKPASAAIDEPAHLEGGVEEEPS
jgi:hypothetical protein